MFQQHRAHGIYLKQIMWRCIGETWRITFVALYKAGFVTSQNDWKPKLPQLEASKESHDQFNKTWLTVYDIQEKVHLWHRVR
jgi:hypothetical protein